MHIAVVGMGCRYPGANSPREFLENILAGRRYFREVPSQRWALADYFDADRSRPDRTYCRQAAVLEGFEFDASEFRIPMSTYLATDVAQWLALSVARDALADADIASPPRQRTTVIMGNTLTGETSRAQLVRFRWPYARRVFDEVLHNLGVPQAQRPALLEQIEARYKRPFVAVAEDNLAGGLSNTIAGRICNHFDFKGGGFTVDGACSSSLLAIQQASLALEQGLCDLALAGGVDVSLDPFEIVGFAKVGALSDSDIRVYDRRANGFLPGEGCGVLVLKRLADAMRDDDRIYCIVRGVGCSSDGRGGITAPTVPGQSLAVDRAYEMAGYPFCDVELIEGHGTGTPVGDRTELQTFIEAKLRHGASDGHRCGIGSVKSIVGHTKAAAGVAGFIKAALSIHHSVLPPTMGISVPHELFDSSTHLYPLIRGGAWRGSGARRAAVSSAGFGGINTHITVESAELAHPRGAHSMDCEWLAQSQQNAEVLLLTASQAGELRGRVVEMADVARQLCHAEMTDLTAHCARTLGDGRIRLAVVADSPGALAERLMRVAAYLASHGESDATLRWIDPTTGIFLCRPRRAARVAFLFPGQGTQALDMSRRLRDRFSVAAEHWRDADAALQSELDGSLSQQVFADEASLSHAERFRATDALRSTRLAQPAIVAASMATTEVLLYLGIEPDLVVGHSLGEFTALWCAGALSKAATLKLVGARGQAMADCASEGGMLSIAASQERVNELLRVVDSGVVIANYNASTQIVVSGPSEALATLGGLCAGEEISTSTLHVSGPFHSPMVAQAQAALLPMLVEQEWRGLNRLMVSSVSGELVGDAGQLVGLLAEQIVSPVRFMQAIECAAHESVELFIDVGPAAVLAGLARRSIDPATTLAVGGEVSAAGDWTGLLQAVAAAFVCGLPVNANRLFEHRFVRPIKLPYAPRFICSPCELPVDPLSFTEHSLQFVRVSPSAQDGAVAAESNLLDRLTGATATLASEAAAPDPSATGLLAFMRSLIRDRFGYPLELIPPDARLLEDLNLDSIKSAEVIGEAMGLAKVRSDPASFAGMPLERIAQRLHQIAQDRSMTSEHAGAPAASWVRAFEGRLVEESLSDAVRVLPIGARVVIACVNADRVTQRLIEHLRSHGLASEIWISNTPAPDVVDFDGLILLLPRALQQPRVTPHTSREFCAPLAQAEFLLEVVQTFSVAFDPMQARRPGRDVPPFIAAVIRSGTLLGHGASRDLFEPAPAASAFLKSWSLEHPDCLVRVLDVDVDCSAESIAERLIDELCIGGRFVEAAYGHSGRRHGVEFVPVGMSSMPFTPWAFSDREVLLVTGGARGITAECLKALADHNPCALALIGSSAYSPAHGDAASLEIGRTLDALIGRGVVVQYFQCDVTDAHALQVLVTQITLQMGLIRGVVHAAGVNEPHRAETVSAAEFRRVLAPKMLGITNLIAALDLTLLRQVVLFSSVIGVSGMAGNSDYAYANAWLSLLAKWLAANNPQLQCRAFQFSIWDEVGMGVRLGSVKSLQRLGVAPIPRAVGVERFVELMNRSWRTVNLVVTARAVGLDTVRFADRPLTAPLRFAAEPLFHQPGVETLCEVTLDPRHDQYLREHNYNGALLFPAVVGMEAMAQVALRCVRALLGEERAPTLENLRFARPIVVPAEGRRIRIHALADEAEPNGSVRVKVGIRSSLDDFETDSFSAECVWRDGPRRSRVTPRQWPEALAVDPQRELYGSLFFQGPMFQHVLAVHDVSPTHCVARVVFPEESGVSRSATVLGAYGVRDTYLHAIQLCVPEHRILPIALERLETSHSNARIAYIVANERERSALEFIYDIDVLGEDGELIEQLRGYRCRIVERFDDLKTVERVLRLHVEARERDRGLLAVNLA